MAISYIHTFVNAGETTRALHLVRRRWRWPSTPTSAGCSSSEPELIPNAIEETLRYYPLNWSGCRTATQDVEIGGQVIEKDDYVVMAYASANRDEDVWERPDEFDVTRSFDRGPPVVRPRRALLPRRPAGPHRRDDRSSSGCWPGSPTGSWPAQPQRWATPFLQGMSTPAAEVPRHDQGR